MKSPKKTATPQSTDSPRTQRAVKDVKSTTMYHIDRLYKATSKRQHKRLRATCVETMDKLKAERRVVIADPFMGPFYLGCEDKAPKVVEIALDCIHKLVADGFFIGNGFVRSAKSNHVRLAVEAVVNMVVDCSKHQNDAILLGVVKTLLTLVTSKVCEVHGQGLMLAMRACYHVFLSSTNAQNQVAARAALTQMVNNIFERMEETHRDFKRIEKVAKEQPENYNLPPQFLKFRQMESILAGMMDVAMKASEQNRSISRVKAERKPGKFGFCRVSGKPANHYCLQTQDPVASVEYKIANLGELLPHLPDTSGGVRTRFVLSCKTHKLQNDCFLVFRAICRLSVKQLAEDSELALKQSSSIFSSFKLFDSSDSEHSYQMRSKQLSLELLTSIFTKAGPTFRSQKRFQEAVREYFVPVLTENSVSTVESVFRQSISTFNALLRNFRSNLKGEIETLLNNVFLTLAELPNTTFQQRHMALTVFSQMCQEPDLVIGLFLNYDCDEFSKTMIFQRIIGVIEKINQSQLAGDYITIEEEILLKRTALETLTKMMNSMLIWTRKSLRARDEAYRNRVEGKDDEEPDEDKQKGFAKKFEDKKKMQLEIESGVTIFNEKPKNGVKYLIEHNLIEDTEEAIVEFLNTAEGLNKTKVGEYLGGEKQRNLKVMHNYIESKNFANMSLDEGVRLLCSFFRLPGEGQKIDRILQKFAERWFLQNPKSEFKNADGPYILAYSIIMLNVNRHNPKVKDKMNKEEFVRNHRDVGGLSDDEPTREMLRRAFDRICAKEIKMEEDEAAGFSGGDTRRVHFIKERNKILSIMKEKNKSGSKKQNRFYEPQHTDLEALESMFSIVWLAALATFSTLFQESEDDEIIELCLEGYRIGFQMAVQLGMEVEAEAFVNSLASFTLLGTMKQMKQKNIEAIKVLLDIAKNDGNMLSRSWAQVLKCISELDMLHMIRCNEVPDAQHLRDDTYVDSHQQRMLESRVRHVDGVMRLHHDINVETVTSQIEPSEIDRIYANSSLLNKDSIVAFATHLCSVSKAELDNRANPRSFSLQKIVEVSHYNMNRVPIVWERIWRAFSAHFAEAGCHANQKIAMLSINSLRQLSELFLEKDELTNFHFQTKFLSPFELIMSRNRSAEIRHLIVGCLFHIVKTKTHKVKSAWKTIFACLTIAAKDNHAAIVSTTWDVMKQILVDYFPLLHIKAITPKKRLPDSNSDISEQEIELPDAWKQEFIPSSLGLETLDECVNCLVEFGCNRGSERKQAEDFTKISKSAIDYLEKCAKYLFQSDMRLRKLKGETSEEYIPIEHSPNIKAWFLCLVGLRRMIEDPRETREGVRTKALDTLFSILSRHGGAFEHNMWKMIYPGVLLPLFDEVMHTHEETKSIHDSNFKVHPVPINLLEKTILPAMFKLISLIDIFYDSTSFLLPELLKLLTACVDQEQENIGKMGIQSWRKFLRTLGPRFSKDEWKKVIEAISGVFESSLPRILLSPELREMLGVDDDGNDLTSQGRSWRAPKTLQLPFRQNVVTTKSLVQLQMIAETKKMIGSFVSRDCFYEEDIVRVFQTFQDSYAFAQNFNSQPLLRERLQQAGFLAQQPRPPDLLLQETRALSAELAILLFLYFGTPGKEIICYSDFKESIASQKVPEFSPDFRSKIETRLVDLCIGVLNDFVPSLQQSKTHANKLKVNLVENILIELRDSFSLELFQASLPRLFEPLMNLIPCGEPQITEPLSRLLTIRLRPLLNLEKPT